MKNEAEVNDEIRYTQGYLAGLRFALGKTDAEIARAETEECAVPAREDTHEVVERSRLRFYAPIGITAGMATLFFGITLLPQSVGWFDVGAGIVLMTLGAIGASKYFRLLRESLDTERKLAHNRTSN